MRVLLDEQLDRRLKPLFDSNLNVQTVQECGWKGKKNGELLRLAQMEFDVFVTMDKGVEYQQNLSQNRLTIVILSAKTNRYHDTAPLILQVNQALKTLQTGKLIHISDRYL